MATSKKKKRSGKRPLVSVVIPCYNEQDTLEYLSNKLRTLPNLLKDVYDVEFCIVDDGSKDFTYRMLQKFFGERKDVRILRHEKNRGFGQALRTGLSHAKGDLIVTIDADTNYDQLEIPIILSMLDDETDLVTASPWSKDGGRQNFPLHRYIYSRTLSYLYRYMLRGLASDIHTFTSGFRVYKRHVIEDVLFEADDFIATAELLIRSILKGYRIKEYPTVVYERKFGRSKLRTFKTIFGHLGMLRKLQSGRIALVKLPDSQNT